MPDSRLKLNLPMPGVDLEATRLRVRDWVAPYGLAERTLFGIEIALEEWLTNVRRHGAHHVELEVAVTADDVQLTIEDDGPPFNPLTAPPPPRPGSLEASRPGGLGLAMIKHVSRNWAYERCGLLNRLHVAVAR